MAFYGFNDEKKDHHHESVTANWRRTVLLVNIQEKEFVLCNNNYAYLKDLQPVNSLSFSLPIVQKVFMRVVERFSVVIVGR